MGPQRFANETKEKPYNSNELKQKYRNKAYNVRIHDSVVLKFEVLLC
jgi:hypothetical protein